MNKHFTDAWYHVRHAGRHLERGIRQELEPAERKAREMTGREKPPEPTRRAKMRENLREAEHKARRRSRDAMQDARKRMRMT